MIRFGFNVFFLIVLLSFRLSYYFPMKRVDLEAKNEWLFIQGIFSTGGKILSSFFGIYMDLKLERLRFYYFIRTLCPPRQEKRA